MILKHTVVFGDIQLSLSFIPQGTGPGKLRQPSRMSLLSYKISIFVSSYLQHWTEITSLILNYPIRWGSSFKIVSLQYNLCCFFSKHPY